MLFRFWAPLVLLSCAAAGAGKRPVTIEAAAASRPETNPELYWSPDGSKVVWLEDKQIWLADGTVGEKRPIAPTAGLAERAVRGPRRQAFDWENRRVREAKLQWSGDGQSLLYTESFDLFLWRFDKQGWEQITATPDEERDPRLSPDGHRVAFRRGWDLYCLEIESRKLLRLTGDGSPTLWNGRLDWVYPEELELGRAFWWSPDSRWIAYLQFDVSREMIHPHADHLPLQAVYEPQRYPKAGTPNPDVRLGVVSAQGGPTRWMDLGETRDALLARVDWMPDSSGLAVQRLNRVQDRLDLLVADLQTGATRPVLRETSPTWINVTDDLRFLPKAGRFLWSTERSGHRHLQLYSMGGKLEKTLTSGNWDVTSVAGVSEQSRFVYFVSTESGPLERHLYRVHLDGGRRERLTASAGTHTISMGPLAELYVDTYSNSTAPPRRTLVRPGSGTQVTLREGNHNLLEDYDLLPTETVEVKADGGGSMYARLVRPAGFQPGRKYPAVVLVYGGPHAQRVANEWAGPNLEQALAQRGFVVWQLDNRGSGGRGHNWESRLYRRLGKQELEDQRRGVEHLLEMGFVDPKRIGIHGSSYGGFMTIYALEFAPDLFRAGVAGSPVTDWRNYDTIYTERYLGLPEDNPEGYRLSSPVHFASRLEGALMIVHNLEDDNVLFQNTVQMTAALTEAGRPYELRVYPQKTHAITGTARKHMYQALVEFFERNLR